MEQLLSDVRGAVYFPARAYHAFQMWREYDPVVAARDMGYAQRLNLNAVRFWLSYEYWLRAPQECYARFNDFLTICQARGIKALPVLFERCGVEPTEAALEADGPLTAFAVYSPGSAIVNDPTRWGLPRQFVAWFMDHFRDDARLLAIEVMNEPDMRSASELKFARAMLQEAHQRRGTIPLTVGSLGTLVTYNLYYLDAGMDILQCHHNFPFSTTEFEALLQSACVAQEVLNKPVWITEWQRVRSRGSGWDEIPVTGDEWQPALATLAPLIHQYKLGNFFWSLMLKPAYLPVQRKKGTLNGIFHEDGAMWSLEDARAVANTPTFDAEERRQWPEWARVIPDSLQR
jgi:hypothetical protein